MKLSIEEIEKVISLRGLDQTEITDIAQAIHALFTPRMKPLSELISVRVPTESEGYFINSVGCLRYMHNQGRESSVIEPFEMGVYLEKYRHEIIGTSILNDQKIVIIYDATPETK